MSVLLFEKAHVKWLDIVTWGGWVSGEKMVDDCQTPHTCSTLGYLTHDAPDFIVVSGTRGSNGSTEYNQHITIPKGCIISIEAE